MEIYCQWNKFKNEWRDVSVSACHYFSLSCLLYLKVTSDRVDSVRHTSVCARFESWVVVFKNANIFIAEADTVP